MICWLKLLLEFNPSGRPTQISRMPNRLIPRNPSSPNSSIGKMPTKKIGNSGSSNNVSDSRVRIGRLNRFNKRWLCVNESTQTHITGNQGEIGYGSLRKL